MKILYSCLSESWGGLEMFTLEIALKLKEHKIDVELLCSPESALYKKAKETDIVVHTARGNNYFNPVVLFFIRRLVKKTKYDLIHSYYSKDLWHVIPALKLTGNKIPVLLTKQVGSFIIKKDFLHKKLYKNVEKVFAISSIIKKNIIDTCPVDEEQVEVLFNCVDIHKFRPGNTNSRKIRAEFGLSDDDITIGMIARFTPGKGHEEMIEAAGYLTKKFKNVKIILVGEPSYGEKEYADKIKNNIEENGLTDNFIFAGFRKDIPNVISSFDLFAFPSHSEAFGIALIEAMAMEIPSVATKSDGVLDIIIDNECGLFFEKKNASDLARKLEYLIINPEKRYHIGKNGRKRVADLFTYEIYIKKLTDSYKSILDKYAIS